MPYVRIHLEENLFIGRAMGGYPRVGELLQFYNEDRPSLVVTKVVLNPGIELSARGCVETVWVFDQDECAPADADIFTEKL